MEAVVAVIASFPSVILLAEKAKKRLDIGGKSEAQKSIEALSEMLPTLKAYLSINGHGVSPEGHKLLEDFINKVQDRVLDIEDAIDEFMYHVPHHEHSNKFSNLLHDNVYWLPIDKATKNLSNQTNAIKEKMRSIADQYTNLPRIQGEEARGSPSAAAAAAIDVPADQHMVGFKNPRRDLVNQLTRGERECVTVLVVGPGGSGKSFLVNNVYQSGEVEFSCKAWITMPHHFSVEVHLMEVLRMSFSERTVEEILARGTAGSIGKSLHRYLEGKKYLIVLDDVLNKKDYDSIAKYLPSGLTGSRIIITTRNSGVVNKPGHTHKLNGLTADEALELFNREAFKGNDTTCRLELVHLSNKIIEKCDRLPLAIVEVARLISTKPQVPLDWSNFYNNIGSEIKGSDNTDLFDRILKPSFVDLSDDLKSCFLYLSMFPEGQSITCGRLVRSWIAKGYVTETKGKTLEEVAKSNLKKLIERCLVQVSTQENDGRIESCKILRLHHAFIVHELYGRERNLFSILDESTKNHSRQKFRHLSVNHVDVAKKLSEIEDPSQIRTLFAFGQQKVSPKDGHFLSIRKKIQGSDDSKFEDVFHKFKLLKVLDLQGMPLHKFPKHIDSFVLLRRLNLRRTNITTVPRSIKKLTLLESLDLKYTMITELPKQMRKLQKLYHLLVSNSSSGFEKGVAINNFAIDALAKSMHEVSLIEVENHRSFTKKLGSLVELRRLGLADVKKACGSELCKSIEKMEHLSKLDVRSAEEEVLDLDHMSKPPARIQRLRLTGRLLRLPRWISSHESLVKVALKGSKLGADQNPLDTIGAGGLQSLIELKMVECYTGEILKFRANSFKRLKKLHIEQFDQLTKFVLETNALVALKILTICKCINLRPLPSSFRLNKLTELVVYEMSDGFIYDIERRVGDFELVMDGVQAVEEASSSSTARGNIDRRIVSRRYLS